MKNIFTAFIKHKDFKRARPWSVVYQEYHSATISTPHYAETVEILLYDGINGNAYIGGRRFSLSGKKVFYISPQTVHSFEYQPSDGHALVVKLHPAMLKEFIDIDRVLSEYGFTLSSLDVCYENHDDFLETVKGLSESDDLTLSLSLVSSLLGLLVKSSLKKNDQVQSERSGGVINEIIAWTGENYGSEFSLGDVAERFGYTKSYFCDMFKAKTGITYIKYLNTVRISAACSLLKSGIPVNQVSRLCGFETDSYFIQLFKKTIGVTPKQYSMKP
jgi:AraC-like DNA-binding protein